MGNICEGGASWIWEPAAEIDITSLRPDENGIRLEWKDKKPKERYRVLWRELREPLYRGNAQGEQAWEEETCEGMCFTIGNLKTCTDYMVKVIDKENARESAVRFARTGFVPGTVVTHLHPKDDVYAFSGRFLGSPGLVRLPSGALFVCTEVFGGDSEYGVALMFRSDDNGETWNFVNRVRPAFHTSVFVHRNELYLMAVSGECGDVLIGKSTDEGKSWTKPVMLMKGAKKGQNGPQRSSLPVVEKGGWLYTSIVYGDHKCRTFNPGVMSVKADSDLLNAENWHISPFTAYDYSWPDAPQGTCPGSIEGNMVIGPDGGVYNFMRLQQSAGAIPATGKSILYKVNTADHDAPMEFVSFVSSPLACSSKFNVHFDEKTDLYIMLGNETLYPDMHAHQRTVLSMAVSKDLLHWELKGRILDYSHMPITDVGLQYPDFIFDGDDILTVVRTSFNGAKNEHDSNYVLFVRIENFRNLL